MSLACISNPWLVGVATQGGVLKRMSLMLLLKKQMLLVDRPASG